jgi:hypothetical protein
MGTLTPDLSKALDDNVELAPSAVTALFVIGRPGDDAELDLDRTGANVLTAGTAGSSAWTFMNCQTVTYTNMASVKSH